MFGFSFFNKKKETKIIGDRFNVIKTLGRGGYGKVKLAIDTNTGQQVAVKLLNQKGCKPTDEKKKNDEITAQ